MKKKKSKLFIACFLSLALMVFIPFKAFSQETMIIKKKNNTVLTIPTAEIESITFSNSSSINSDNTVSDIDGNIYKTVKIGTQIWMAENLKTTKLNNGTPISKVTDNDKWKNLLSPGYCYYDNDESNRNIYGALYNWYSMNNNNVCPTGWHVPNEGEWDILTDNLGDNSGKELKETGTTHWESPNSGVSNSTEFTALPSGYRNGYNSLFTFKGGTGLWWTSSRKDQSKAATRAMWSNSSKVGIGQYSLTYGVGIRCIKD